MKLLIRSMLMLVVGLCWWTDSSAQMPQMPYQEYSNQLLCRSVEPETGATLLGYDGPAT